MFPSSFRYLIVLLILFFTALLLQDPLTTRPEQSFAIPNSNHLFGTDHLGRDVLSRLVFGGFRTIGMAIGAVIIATTFGTLIGILMSLHPIAEYILRIVLNSLLAFPSLITAFIIIAILGRGMIGVATSVGIALIPLYAFIVHSRLIAVHSEHFVEVAYSLGASKWHIYRTHLLPNSRQTLLSYAGVMFAYSLLNGAGLSFLGLGDDPSLPEWGVMLAEGRFAFRQALWVALMPGLCLTGLVFLVNRLVDRLNRFE